MGTEKKRSVHGLGVVANVLRRVEDAEGEAVEEVARCEQPRDRAQRPAREALQDLGHVLQLRNAIGRVARVLLQQRENVVVSTVTLNNRGKDLETERGRTGDMRESRRARGGGCTRCATCRSPSPCTRREAAARGSVTKRPRERGQRARRRAYRHARLVGARKVGDVDAPLAILLIREARVI